MSSNAVFKLDAHNFSSAKGEFPPAGQDHLALPVAGKVTVVLMWAAWSPPCKESIPHLNALKQEFLKPDGDSDLVVVAISEDKKDDVERVAALMGNNINNLDYLLCLNEGGRMPKFAEDIEAVPSVFLFSNDGVLKFPGGHPLDPEFELKVRSELKTLAGAKGNRRAVFLEAADVPKQDKWVGHTGYGKSDPFGAIFVRRKSDNAEWKKWAMCPFSPYNLPVEHMNEMKNRGGRHTIENLLMTTEVLRDCSNPVWSNPACFDAADFGESFDNWEVKLAVYDHVRCPAPARCAI